MKEGRSYETFERIFALYLAIHHAYLVPYAEEIFGLRGMLPDPSANLTFAYFPSVFSFTSLAQHPAIVPLVLSFCAAMMFVFRGAWIFPLLLWYGQAALLHRNNLIENPSLAVTGWLLLACAGIRFAHRPVRQEMIRRLVVVAWVLLGLGYSLSGYHKLLNSPSWTDGAAIELILRSPLAYPWVQNIVLIAPAKVFVGVTWFTLFTELFFLPAILFAPTRLLFLILMTGIHIGLLFTLSFPDLTIGVLMMHLFALIETGANEKRAAVPPRTDGLPLSQARML